MIDGDLNHLAQQAERMGRQLKALGSGLRPLNDEGPEPPVLSVVNFSESSRLLAYAADDLTVSVEAGMTVGALNRELMAHGQWIPGFDRGGNDTLGGLVASGLDTPFRGGYGSLARRVLALQVWTPGFGFIRTGAPVVKNVAGYSLGRLFWGSRGVFGLITQITLKLAPLPEEEAWWMVSDIDSDWVASLTQWARPWAVLGSITRRQRTEGIAVWHGRRAMVQHLAGNLGKAQDQPMNFFKGDKPCQLTGAVPLGACQILVKEVPAGVDLLMEWQSGWFVAESLDPEALQFLAQRIEVYAGVAVTLRGMPPIAAPFPKPMATIYRRLRQHYDPRGILVDPWQVCVS